MTINDVLSLKAEIFVFAENGDEKKWFSLDSVWHWKNRGAPDLQGERSLFPIRPLMDLIYGKCLPSVEKKLMEELKKKGYGIYVLSNYSEELFTLHTKDLPFWELVDGGVISYEIRQIKPNPPIYRHLFEKYQLKAQDCLFFDDRPENTEGARKLGMQAVTVVGGSEEFLEKELEKLLAGVRDNCLAGKRDVKESPDREGTGI